jgi:hypothetical protein
VEPPVYAFEGRPRRQQAPRGLTVEAAPQLYITIGIATPSLSRSPPSSSCSP